MASYYYVRAIDSDEPSAWMHLATVCRPLHQDSGRCAYRVETDDAAALEAALDDDDTVLSYEVR